jgi:hypothetical protein
MLRSLGQFQVYDNARGDDTLTSSCKNEYQGLQTPEQTGKAYSNKERETKSKSLIPRNEAARHSLRKEHSN